MITLLIIVLSLLACLFFLGTLVQILAAVVFGLIAGAVARWIVPGTQYMPWWQTALLGIAGSVAAGILGAVTGIGNLGIIGSILGAVLVLFVVGRLRASGIIVLLLACTLAGVGCATMTVNNIAGYRMDYENGEILPPRPYLYSLLPLAIVFDVATSPVQAIWLGSQL